MLQMTSEKFFGPTIPLTLTPLSGARDSYLGNKAPIGQRFSILYIIELLMLHMMSEKFFGPTIPLTLTPMSGPRDSYLWNEGSDRSAVFNFVHSLSS